MKVLVTGVKGQLGYDIVTECIKNGIDAIGVDIEEMDITDNNSVSDVIVEGNYDAVIHCAAWTAVDLAEDEVEKCTKVNVEGTKNIAAVCSALDIPLMYFSTDYVFSGTGEKPWVEDDEKAPLSVYGKTKYEGEKYVLANKKHFIIRISWVFGINGKNFVKTMLNLGSKHKKLKVVADQVGSPTYTFDLAQVCVEMIQTTKYGDYHITNEGYCSWYEFAKEIFEVASMDVEVIPVASSEFPTKAVRPKNSRMAKDKLIKSGFRSLPTWQDAVRRYVNILDSQSK